MISRQKYGKIAICCALAASVLCIALPFAALPAGANSGPGFIPGTGGTGVYPADSCPLEVESELLTFNISGYPDPDDMSGYGSTVTARYTFYNPTSEDVTVGMLFPFGLLPDYAMWTDESFSDSHLFSVTEGEGGVPLGYNYRISYDYNYGYIDAYFDFESARAGLSAAPIEHGVLSYDCPVTVYTCTDAEASLVARFTPTYAFYTFSDGFYSVTGEQGVVEVVINYGESLYFAGGLPGDLQFFSRTYAYSGGSGGLAAESEDMPVAAPEPSDTTFIEFIRGIKPQSMEGVSDADWFNYIVNYMCASGISYSSLWGIGSRAMYAMRWLEYELTVPAGGKIINSVTVPVYPDINIDTSPYSYDYLYYLSPASYWADFGTLTVRINTADYLLSNTSGLEFIKDDGGYTALYGGLPAGELYFELCTSAQPESDNPVGAGIAWLIFVIILLAFVPVMLVAAGLITTIVLVRRDKARHAKHDGSDGSACQN